MQVTSVVSSRHREERVHVDGASPSGRATLQNAIANVHEVRSKRKNLTARALGVLLNVVVSSACGPATPTLVQCFPPIQSYIIENQLGSSREVKDTIALASPDYGTVRTLTYNGQRATDFNLGRLQAV